MWQPTLPYSLASLGGALLHVTQPTPDPHLALTETIPRQITLRISHCGHIQGAPMEQPPHTTDPKGTP